jgi:hypothetical protein
MHILNMLAHEIEVLWAPTMSFFREKPDVIPEGLILLLPAALSVPGVARVHVGALEIASKDLP